MGTLALNADERVDTVEFTEESLVVALKDGRRISVPIEWYPRLARASAAERSNWQICGGGYGIHWPDLDEDLSTEGLLRGAPAPHKGFNRTPENSGPA
jgi:hypothetical protein